jgi:hypothetical protein
MHRGTPLHLKALPNRMGRTRSYAWWIVIGAISVSLMMVASGSNFITGFLNGTLTTTTVNYCASLGGFGNGPSAYMAGKQGVYSSVVVSGTCSGSNNGFSSLTLNLNPYAGATNITLVDALRFYWNGSTSAVVTFQFSSSGTSFFASSGPYGYMLINSTTAGSFPVHSTDDCVGGGGVTAPGTGNCKLQLLPLPSGTAGATAATGTAGNTVTGLINLSAPSSVICPPVGAAWNTGASSCTSGSLGSVVAALASGPSYVVISFGFSDAPNSYPGGTASFSVTVTATVNW